MFNKLLDLSEEYFQEYEVFVQRNSTLGKLYLSTVDSIYSNSRYFQLLRYNSTNIGSTDEYLIVPSVINSPEILFLGVNNSFITNLRQLGSVYLVKWLEVEDIDLGLNEYAAQICRVIYFIKSLSSSNSALNLIGHCLGGNIATLACLLKPNIVLTKINSLTLLTTAWDFTHYQDLANVYKQMNFNQIIKNFPLVPKEHLQVLFFMQNTEAFSKKLKKYFSLRNISEKELFLRVENWLASGNDLPSKLFSQLIDNLIINNEFACRRWKIAQNIVDFSYLKIPVCHVIAQKDQIVPKSSILALHNLLNNSKIIEVKGGHINFLINSEEFFQSYRTYQNKEELTNAK